MHEQNLNEFYVGQLFQGQNCVGVISEIVNLEHNNHYLKLSSIDDESLFHVFTYEDLKKHWAWKPIKHQEISRALYV